MNYSMGAPEPVTGETIWMRCPYVTELCGTDATLTVESITEDAVAGRLVCANGHAWSVTRLGEDGEE